MQLNPTHPAFDMKHEFLCMLSGNPLPLLTIAEDLGMPTQRSLRPLIEGLRADGHEIETCRDNERGGFCAYLGATYHRSREVAGKYFDTVYPRRIGD